MTEKVTETKQKILDLMFEDPKITTSDMCDRLGLSRKTVSKHIKELKESGMIERVGSDRKGYWKIIKTEENGLK